MFSSSHQFRSIIQGSKQPRMSYSPVPTLPSHLSSVFSPQNKIETKQSFISQTLTNSFISDNGYNSMIYEWRKNEIAPIVKVVELTKTSQIDSLTGFTCTHNTIQPEPIASTLSRNTLYRKEEVLLIFRSMLDGHQAIFKKMKATSVSLQKCVITLKGEVKVWVNQFFQKNDISGQILNNQESIVRRIFQTVSYLSNNSYNKIQDFIEYVDSCIKKNGKWTFLSMKAMIKSYVDCLRIKIPKFIRNDPNREYQNIQCSFVQNNTHQLKYLRPRQSSFQLSQRNIYSSLNCSSNLRRMSQLSQQSNENKNIDSFFLNKVMTSKSIHDKQTSYTLKSLASKTKHTNSISGIREKEEPKDTILQNSRHNRNNQTKEGFSFLGGNLKNQLFQQHRKVPSINQILISKIGISPLREVQDDDQYSNSPSARKTKLFQKEDRKINFNIAPQFDLQIKTPIVQSSTKPSKDSSISTTNQTIASGYQFCFSKKLKDSHITINLDQNKENQKSNDEFRTASRDRFKDVSSTTFATQPKKVGSCTNWSNHTNIFDLKNLIKKVQVPNIVQTKEESELSSSIRSSTKLQFQKQVISYKNLETGKQQGASTPNKALSAKNILKNQFKNLFGCLNQLSSQQEIESYYHTEKNSVSGSSPSPSRKKIHVQQKIFELLQLKRGLVISTYMETNSQKKIRQNHDSPEKERQRERRLQDIQQTLAQIVKANLKQQQIIEGNCWTKKLQNLLGIEEQQLKQSINFGAQQANALLCEIKLSKLGKWGRQIQKSVIPE